MGSKVEQREARKAEVRHHISLEGCHDPLTFQHHSADRLGLGSLLFGSSDAFSLSHGNVRQLLDVIAPTKRGLTATPEQKQEIETLCQQLEKLNPTPKPLASPLLNGRWQLVSNAWIIRQAAIQLDSTPSCLHGSSLQMRLNNCS